MDEALTIAAQVADALAYAHGRGVVHRDIKPENILLGGGHAMVADFGVAKAAALEHDPDAPLTQLGFVVGTPHYMSPEQAAGGETIDARSDQYSLGCTVFEMLAGEPPFAGSAGKSVVAQSLTAPRPRVSERRPEVGAMLDPTLQRAMAVDPDARFPDMAAFAEALQSGRGAAAGRWIRRRAVLLGAFIAAVAAGAGAWLGTRFGRHTVEPAAENLAVLPFTHLGPGCGIPAGRDGGPAVHQPLGRGRHPGGRSPDRDCATLRRRTVTAAGWTRPSVWDGASAPARWCWEVP